MIKFEIDSSKEGVEIYLDNQGIDEFVKYLTYIKKEAEHMHLIAGNELSEDPSQNDGTNVKHVKLIFVD